MALIPEEARALADYLAATATALAVREHTQAEHDEVHAWEYHCVCQHTC